MKKSPSYPMMPFVSAADGTRVRKISRRQFFSMDTEVVPIEIFPGAAPCFSRKAGMSLSSTKDPMV